MLTKAELEDIWHNKPHGHFKKISKKLSKIKKYSVSLLPITYIYHEEYKTEVFAEDQSDAYQQAKLKYYEINPNAKINSWNLNGATII